MNMKYRIWIYDDEGGHMIYLEPTIGRYDYENGYVLSFVERGYDGFGAHERYDMRENYVIMPWTGLKDKNGKDIYEKDVLRDIEGTRGIVTHDGRRFTACDELGWDNLEYPEESEVIGNIFEEVTA
jgi:hypothetical protein